MGFIAANIMPLVAIALTWGALAAAIYAVVLLRRMTQANERVAAALEAISRNGSSEVRVIGSTSFGRARP